MTYGLSFPQNFSMLIGDEVKIMIKFAICDDESYMLEDIAGRLLRYMENRRLPCQISRFSSGKELLESGKGFDVLFLDIQMERPDGMETARLLRRQGYRGLLVFITILKENVFDAFEVQAFDYLVKPLEESRFRRAMERAIRYLEQEAGKSLLVQKGNACQVVPFTQIVYCEVLGRKIYLHRPDGETVDYYGKLEELENRMDSRFFKCHRSYLVNLDYVRGCMEGLVTLSDGSKVPVSRLRERELTQALLVHMKERRW